MSEGHPRGTHSHYVIGCCLIPLGICGLKNNSRRITYGIGCVGGCLLCPLYPLLPRVNNSNKLFHFRTALFLRILNLREMSKQLKPILEFISLSVLSLSSSGYFPCLSFQLSSFSISFRYARQLSRLRRSRMALFEVWYVCVLFLIDILILR